MPHGMQLLSAERSGSLGRWRNSVWKTIRRTIRRPGHTVRCKVIRFLQKTSKAHLLGKKVLPGIFLGYALIAGGIWKELFWLQTLRSWEFDASEIHARRPDAKEILRSRKGETFIFLIADGGAKVVWKRSWSPRIPLRRDRSVMSQIWKKNFKETLRGLNQQKHKMTLKPAILVNRRWLPIIVITLNLEFTSACRKKNLSHLHWRILTWPGRRTQFSMYCRKIVSTIIRTSAWIELCRIHGQGSWSSLYWARKLPPGFLWSGWRLTKISSNYQTCFSVAWNLAWHVKSSYEEGEADSTTLENWKVFASSIQKMENVKRPS